MKRISLTAILFFLSMNSSTLKAEFAQLGTEGSVGSVNGPAYTASKESVKQFFDALAARMNRPAVVSTLAAKKKISGSFSFSQPETLLEDISRKMGLVWYFDGNTLYIFDASELKSGLIRLKNSSVNEIKKFLISSDLYDERYPLRSKPGSQTFYLSAPPIYYDLVLKTANYLDQVVDQQITDTSSFINIPLYNIFVENRNYHYRDEIITIPGIASVIRSLISPESSGSLPVSYRTAPPADILAENENREELEESDNTFSLLHDRSRIHWNKRYDGISPGNGVQVIANPDSNSLLVKGKPEELRKIRQLVKMLDVPKRHIEMSVWIIDLKKEEMENLGVIWGGTYRTGDRFGSSLNSGGFSSTVNGASFIATVKALSAENRANIVSRPMLLTQENVPAIFDNNTTFYTSLLAERAASLEHVTWGTTLSVLPRFTDSEEIEMMLSVEDGDSSGSGMRNSDLPKVKRTNISTVARVPKGKSLLIGGYTRDEKTDEQEGIPGLRSIPFIGRLFSYRSSQSSNAVRLFLIEPKEINAGNIRDGRRLISELRNKSATSHLFDWMNNFLDAQR